jgi:Rps23 Pro-64 3,4-dihydroxylase Tpa1-like proline 4-hydroxylase
MQENISILTPDALSKRDQLVNLIINRLNEAERSLQRQFLESVGDVGVRYCFVDDLLPEKTAQSIYDVFPDVDSMRLMKSFREQKYTSKSFEKFNPLMGDITFAIQDPRVVAVIERITGIKNQIPDEHLYAGGLSVMGRDHFLGPHIDNSHDSDRIYYRTLNLLYYVSPDWKRENGGNLELWDKSVRRHVTIDSKFNRLAIMETNPWSWHSVSKIGVERLRYCISNYYFSAVSPIGRDYFNVTSFSARPEQKVRRALAWVDNRLRQAVRVVVPQGVGKKDIYEGSVK